MPRAPTSCPEPPHHARLLPVPSRSPSQIFSKKGVGCSKCLATKQLEMQLKMPISSPLPFHTGTLCGGASDSTLSQQLQQQQAGAASAKAASKAPLCPLASSGPALQPRVTTRLLSDSYKINMLWCSFLAGYSYCNDSERQRELLLLRKMRNSLQQILREYGSQKNWHFDVAPQARNKCS